MSLFTLEQAISKEEYHKIKDTSVEIEYHGKMYEFTRRFYDFLADEDVNMSKYNGKIYFVGYEHKCPKCGIAVLLNNTIHKITITVENGKELLTVSPSSVCPHGCGWHVWVKDGKATDC
jgi:hypothetical protein